MTPFELAKELRAGRTLVGPDNAELCWIVGGFYFYIPHSYFGGCDLAYNEVLQK